MGNQNVASSEDKNVVFPGILTAMQLLMVQINAPTVHLIAVVSLDCQTNNQFNP